jgi:hypothetical protein
MSAIGPVRMTYIQQILLIIFKDAVAACYGRAAAVACRWMLAVAVAAV